MGQSTDANEPHEYPKPEYSPQFAEPPSEAYARGVNDGIAWVCNEASRRASPEGYKMAIANNRLGRSLADAVAEIDRLKMEHWIAIDTLRTRLAANRAEAKAKITRLQEELLQYTYRDDMGR